jgi:hypothetical protein
MAMASAVRQIKSADQPLGGIERDGKIAYELASLFGDLSPLIVRFDVEQVEGDPTRAELLAELHQSRYGMADDPAGRRGQS